MLLQKRGAKVFVAALISILSGGMILKLLGDSPPAAGAFSLSEYYRLESVEKAISSRSAQYPGRWDKIEVYCSDRAQDQPKQLKSVRDAGERESIRCHFFVFNRPGSEDGEIMATESWQDQLSITPGNTSNANERMMRVCVVVDSMIDRPTDSQIKRTEAVVEALSRRFDIRTSRIYYPQNWWLGSVK